MNITLWNCQTLAQYCGIFQTVILTSGAACREHNVKEMGGKLVRLHHLACTCLLFIKIPTPHLHIF
jgi:hypothetical protein